MCWDLLTNNCDASTTHGYRLRLHSTTSYLFWWLFDPRFTKWGRVSIAIICLSIHPKMVCFLSQWWMCTACKCLWFMVYFIISLLHLTDNVWPCYIRNQLPMVQCQPSMIYVCSYISWLWIIYEAAPVKIIKFALSDPKSVDSTTIGMWICESGC